MKFNQEIFTAVSQANAKLVVVSKYLDASQTDQIWSQIKDFPELFALGENRIEAIKTKQIPRKFCHFLGNIQSRDLRAIAEYCSVIHSLESLKHAKKLAALAEPPAVFLQINVSNEPQKHGILPENFPDFLQKIPQKLSVVGISALGAKDVSEEKKRAEFRLLKEIRGKYNSGWLISAGTSADYAIALDEGIDVVRVGRALF